MPPALRGSEESSAGKQSHDLAGQGATGDCSPLSAIAALKPIARDAVTWASPAAAAPGCLSRSTGDILGQTVVVMGADLCLAGCSAAFLH